MATIGVFVHVFDRQGRILLVQQSYSGCNWTTPGGRIESNEGPTEAAERELLEETGIMGTVTDFLGLYCKPYCDDIVVALYADALNIPPKWHPTNEIRDCRWTARHLIPAPMAFNTRVRILDAFDGLRGVMKIFPSVDVVISLRCPEAMSPQE